MTRALRAASLVLPLLTLAPSASAQTVAPTDQLTADRAWKRALETARASIVGDLDAALAAYARAQDLAEVFDGSMGERRRLTLSMAALAETLGLPAEAIRVYDEAIALYSDPADAAQRASLAQSQAALLEAQGDPERAEARLRLAIEARESDPSANAAQRTSLSSSLSRLIEQVRPADPEAEELLRRNLELDDSGVAHRGLAQYFARRGDHDRAVALYETGLERVRADTKSPWRIPGATADLARALESAGRLAESEALFEQLVQARRDAVGPRALQTAHAQTELADVLIEQERFAEAETLLRRALQTQQDAYGNCGPCTRATLAGLSQVYGALGREVDFCVEPEAHPAPVPLPAAAEARRVELDFALNLALTRREFSAARRMATELLEIRQQIYGVDAPQLVDSLKQLAEIEMRLGRTAAQVALLQRMLAVLEQSVGSNDTRIAETLQQLGSQAEMQEDWPAARDYYRRESGIRVALAQNYLAAAAFTRLGRTYGELGDERAAGEQYLEAARLHELMGGTDGTAYVNAALELARSYDRLGLQADARATLDSLLEHEEQRDPRRESVLRMVLRGIEAHLRVGGEKDRADQVGRRIAELDSAR